MVFSSTTFLFLFLPLLLIIYLLVSSTAWRNTILLVFSLSFYAWGEGPALVIMLLSIGANFWIGQKIYAHSQLKARRHWLTFGLIINIGLLAFFKYANFLVENLNWALHFSDVEPIYLPLVHLPIGISFFTFQAISYLIDVYRSKGNVQIGDYSAVSPASLPRLALYISLFPQLIAGPIVRYGEVARAFSRRKVTLESASFGTQRFVFGLAKKVLIADPLGYVADQAFGAEVLGTDAAWLGAVCYALQIYYDFSGYSDMAIGLGKILGFNFPENFNYPYISHSIREFWRRWHITLSRWFRDYLYIPLGGNRHHVGRNLLIVFLLCGLWHGAAWTYIVWGMLHGLFLVLERGRWGKILSNLPSALQHTYVLAVVGIAWIIFRAENWAAAVNYTTALLGMGKNELALTAGAMINGEVLTTLFVGLVFSVPIFQHLQKLLLERLPILYYLGLFLLLILSVFTVLGADFQPFIYFRF